MRQLIVAFNAGILKRKLAERYGISESSVKRIIRQLGASKPSSTLYLGQGRYRLGLHNQGLWPVSDEESPLGEAKLQVIE